MVDLTQLTGVPLLTNGWAQSSPFSIPPFVIYASEIGGMLEPGFWSLDYPSRDVDRSLVLNHHSNSEAMQEEDSDNCIAEIFGTSRQTHEKSCQISQKCWELMTKPGYSGYSLSHEVFYLQIGEAVSHFEIFLI